MRLFVDARKLQHGGIGRYLENLLQGLFKEPSLELLIVCGSTSDVNFLEDLSQHRAKTTFLVDSSSQYSLSEYFIFPLKYKKLIDSSDWYISPHYTLPFFIRCKKLVVVHDCIHVTYPDSLLHKLVGRLLILSALKRADKVLTVSESSRDALMKEFAVKDKNLDVIPNSILPLFSSYSPNMKKEVQTSTRLLFIGTDRAHKRLRLFLEFLNLLKGSDFKFHASIVSDLSDDSREYMKNNELSYSTKIYSKVSNQELLEIYKESNFLICTSAEEGFCLPILEAMSLGLSIIAPKRPFSEELLSEVGWYFEPGSAADLLRVFVSAFKDVDLRGSKIKSGIKRAENYTLEKNAPQFLDILRAT